MKSYSVLILSCLTCFILCSCSPWKQTLVSQGDINDAVENAIKDFTHTSKKLLKDDKNYSIWIDSLKEDILFIYILGTDNVPLIANSEIKPGVQYGYFPTNYKVVDGKLFYWYDPLSFINEEILNVLKEFDHIYYQKYEYDFPEYSLDDAKKAAMYYFCMNDLTYYKKHVSSRSLPENKLPKMKCR